MDFFFPPWFSNPEINGITEVEAKLQDNAEYLAPLL